MIEVEIHQVHTTSEGSLLTLAMSGAVGGDTAYLVLSLNELPSAQDIELGLVGVHAEWNDQAHSGHNLIQSTHWNGPDLIIESTKLAQERGFPKAMLLRTAASHLDDNDRILADTILAGV